MKTLVLVTERYPYYNSETFLENEICYLSEAFNNVLIYATEVSGDVYEHRAVPANVSVFVGGGNDVRKADYLKSCVKGSVIKEIGCHCLQKDALGKIAACCHFDQCVTQSSKKIPTFVQQYQSALTDSEVVVYSYWLSTIGMTALRIYDAITRINPNVRVVSRCHGFDLYDERAYLHYQPFKDTLVKQMENIYPCSKQGGDYLKRQYPQYEEKVQTAYLGVADCFKSDYPQKDNAFRIVSCSNIIPLKRVDKILEAVTQITDVPVHWTHFGDGELFNDLQEKAKHLPANINVDFKGRVPNSDIYDYYNTHNVNLFINVSTSEGLPVSIMEAASFGIPIIATDVGGTNEIVCDGANGFLLDENFSLNELVCLIQRFIDMDERDYARFCYCSREIYEQQFSAEKNYTEFCQLLINGESNESDS